MQIVFHHIPKAGGSSVIRSFSVKKNRLAFQDQADDWTKVRLIDGLNSSHYAFKDYDGKAFYMTWVRNPADMFYSGFRFYSRSAKPHPEYRPVETRRFIRQYVKQCETIEQYTDQCLSDDHPHTFPRGMFDLHWDRFDFIGVTERMQESLDTLGKQLGLKLEAHHVNASGSDNNYRRAEVEQMLAREMEIYNRWS